MYICTYILIYLYTYMLLYLYTYTLMCVYMHIQICAGAHIYACTYVYIYIYMYICICAYMYMCMCTKSQKQTLSHRLQRQLPLQRYDIRPLPTKEVFSKEPGSQTAIRQLVTHLCSHRLQAFSKRKRVVPPNWAASKEFSLSCHNRCVCVHTA